MGKIKYCDKCVFLSPWERHQRYPTLGHKCLTYEQPIHHFGFHPRLPRPRNCRSYLTLSGALGLGISLMATVYLIADWLVL